MPEHRPAPSKDDIALLPPFERVEGRAIALINSLQQAQDAFAELAHATALGFDTESKPTFAKDEASTGPHVLQLSTATRAYVIQLADAACAQAVAQWLAQHPAVKVGFGLGDDVRRISAKLGVRVNQVVDLNHVFKQLGYRTDMGVKAAVALLFDKRYLKSKKAATSNWASPHLTEAQISYAANDAYAAMRVYDEMKARGMIAPGLQRD